MNDYAFYQCKAFLEQRILDQPENNALVQAYVSLIEQKTNFDIAFFSQNAEVQKNWNTNQMETARNWHQTQADITKKQIEVGQKIY